MPGGTPIFEAVANNNMTMLHYLLRRGANLDTDIEARRVRTLTLSQRAQEILGNDTVEDWARMFINTEVGYNVQIEKYRRAPMLHFLADLRAAGGTMKGFLRAPRMELCLLRLLCEKGRAVPILGQVGARMAWPRVVEREEGDLLEFVFAWAPAHATDSHRRTRHAKAAVRASHIKPLPRGVFMLVLSFWGSSRDRLLKSPHCRYKCGGSW